MNTHIAIKSDPRQALIDAMDMIRAGMLGVEGAERPMQPMTHFPDWDKDRLWFLTARDSALVQSLIAGARANYCVMNKEQGFDACLIGMLSQDHDAAQLDKIWSPMAAAWFKGGKRDPNLTMLRLDLTEAALWSSSDSLFSVGYEILKSTLNPDRTPDLGAHEVLRF